jgi:hypothetical protein
MIAGCEALADDAWLLRTGASEWPPFREAVFLRPTSGVFGRSPHPPSARHS